MRRIRLHKSFYSRLYPYTRPYTLPLSLFAPYYSVRADENMSYRIEKDTLGDVQGRPPSLLYLTILHIYSDVYMLYHSPRGRLLGSADAALHHELPHLPGHQPHAEGQPAPKPILPHLYLTLSHRIHVVYIPQEIIRAFAYLKHGAARANHDAGILPAEKRDLIAQVSCRIWNRGLECASSSLRILPI